MNRDKVVFKSVLKAKAENMDEEMYQKIEKWARETLEDLKVKYKDEVVNYIFTIQEVANYIKEKLEDTYKDKDLCWHVVVGRNFGGYVTYQEKIYTYFYIGQMGFLIFATVKFLIN